MVTPDKVNEDSTLGKYDLYFTGWSLGPDPDFQLSINTCDSRPNADGSGDTSENNWCSPEFDQLFKAQHAELDKAKRAEMVKEAFTTIYEAYVSNPIYYIEPLEAYRSDKVEGFVTQPENGGVILNQTGYWGLYGAELVSADAADDGRHWPGWLIPAVVVVVLLGVGGLRGRTSPRRCSRGPGVIPRMTDPVVAESLGHDDEEVRGTSLPRYLALKAGGALISLAMVGGARLLHLPGAARRPGHHDDAWPADQSRRGRASARRARTGPAVAGPVRSFTSATCPAATSARRTSTAGRSPSSSASTSARPLLLTGSAAVISIMLGLWLGQKTAWRRDSWFDRLHTGIALVFWSVPTFWLGLLLLLMFGGWLQLLPTGGMTTPGAHYTGFAVRPGRRRAPRPAGDGDGRGRLRAVPDGHAGVAAGGDVRRLPRRRRAPRACARTSCAAARGAQRPAAHGHADLPDLGGLIGGAVTVETVFSWPGLGYLTYKGLSAPDLPLLQGTFVVFSAAVIAMNFVADLRLPGPRPAVEGLDDRPGPRGQSARRRRRPVRRAGRREFAAHRCRTHRAPSCWW